MKCSDGYTSPAGSDARSDCYKTCTEYSVSNGTMRPNSSTVYEPNDCSYYLVCNSGYTDDGNGNCVKAGCAEGEYENSSGVCTKCEAGYKCTGGVRTQCSSGTYQDETGQTSCKSCPTASTYASDVTGYWSWSSDGVYTDVTQCRVSFGTTTVTNGTVSSFSCGYCDGDYGVSSNCGNTCQAVAATCKAATYAPSGTGNYQRKRRELVANGVCQSVGASYWSAADSLTRSECTNKPAGSYYTGTGASSSSCPWTCNSGYTQNGNSCEKLCNSGDYINDNGECTSCPNGYWSDTGLGSIDSCYTVCYGGEAVLTPGAPCELTAGGWYWDENTFYNMGGDGIHTVYYGNLSPVSYCPLGYTNGYDHVGFQYCGVEVPAGYRVTQDFLRAKYLILVSDGVDADGNEYAPFRLYEIMAANERLTSPDFDYDLLAGISPVTYGNYVTKDYEYNCDLGSATDADTYPDCWVEAAEVFKSDGTWIYVMAFDIGSLKSIYSIMYSLAQNPYYQGFDVSNFQMYLVTNTATAWQNMIFAANYPRANWTSSMLKLSAMTAITDPVTFPAYSPYVDDYEAYYNGYFRWVQITGAPAKCAANTYKGANFELLDQYSACKSCPTDYPNTASTGSTAITQCYSGTKQRPWNGTQNACPVPDGCSAATCAECTLDTTCDYVAYSNSTGDGDGTIKSGCETNSEGSCDQTVASVTAAVGAYVDGLTCPSCSAVGDGSYTLSDDGNTGGTEACYKECSVPCTQPECTYENATCAYSDTPITGKHYYGGSCDAVASACAIVDYLCNSGYNKTFSGVCALTCTGGVTTLRTGTGVIVPLYAEKLTTPAINIRTTGGQMCYANLAEGTGDSAINVKYGDATYHTVD